MMKNSGTMMNSFGIAESFTPPSKIETFTGKMDITIGDHEITLNETPGHTDGSICIIGEGFILTGETLFRLSVGRVDIGGNQDDLVKSLKRVSPVRMNPSPITQMLPSVWPGVSLSVIS